MRPRRPVGSLVLKRNLREEPRSKLRFSSLRKERAFLKETESVETRR
jgi:hypothetical protein